MLSEPTLDRLRIALADRYVIEREVGAGGMATVYVARDLKHRRPVAIKVMRPELAATIGAERFLREIEIAANLTHPHIVPLYDSGEAGGFLYYVMPYIKGENLRQRMSRQFHESGRGLPLDEAIRITRVVAEALHHAHRSDIVHRDIKPENILLADGDPVVTDFGIARALSAAGGGTLTQAGSPVGTPRYMSPEQARGEADTDARADIYSLALILYEMLVGALPLGPVRKGPLIREMPPEHRARLAKLPPAVLQALGTALAEDPRRRFKSAAAFGSALKPTWQAWGGPGVIWKPVATAATVVVVLALAGTWFWRSGRRSDAVLPANRVLMTAFVNQTGDSSLNAVGAMATDWLTRGLQETGVIQVVDARLVASDSALTGNNGGGGTAWIRAARDAGTGTLITGAYYRRSDSLQFVARVIEPETGTVLHTTEPVAGLVREPLGAVEALRQQVAGAMASILDRRWPAAIIQPPTYDAYREYVNAVPLVGRQDYPGAISGFLRAWAYDSTFAMAPLYAAILMTEGGMYGAADSLLYAVRARRERLRPSERRVFEYLDARLRGDHEASLGPMQEVAAASPMSEAMWEDGQILLRLNRPREAVSVLEGLDPTRGLFRSWWFYWNVLAAAHHMLGQHRAELAVAREGRAAHPDDIGVSTAEYIALAAQGRWREVLEQLGTARTVAPADLQGPAPPLWELTEVARELRAHGSPDAARQLLERVRVLAPDLPVEVRTSVIHRTHMAMVAYLLEEWDEAQEQFEALAAESPADVNYRGYLATIAVRKGDTATAGLLTDWLTQLENAPYLYGVDLVWRARVAALEGESVEAVSLLRRAFAQGMSFYGTSPFVWPSGTDVQWLHRDMDLEPLRSEPAFQAMMRPKG